MNWPVPDCIIGNRLVPAFGKVEKGERAWARVRTDDGVEHVNLELRATETLLDELDEGIGVFLAITVADEHFRIGCGLIHGLFHVVDESLNRLFATADLLHGDELSLVVHMKNWLYVEQRTCPGARTRHASAAE